MSTPQSPSGADRTTSRPAFFLRPASALRDVLREGYSRRDLTQDVLAGIVVGIVALPLAMALAIAAGVPPQHGLYTAIVAGGAIALLGGSRTQVSGPTAAFVVILAPISHTYGIGGLLLATMMAGAILAAMGLARMGKLIEFIPHPVTTGFTAGIAVVIATLQVDKVLGLTGTMPGEWLHRVEALTEALPTARWADALVAAATLAALIVMPRVTKKVPAPLVALTLGAVLAVVVERVWGTPVATIGRAFHYVVDGVSQPGIPPMLPHFALPWTLPDASGQPLVLTFGLVKTLLPSAFAIAILGAIESLLCAVVADGMAGTRHDPDVELLAQGTGNLLGPFFGGIAATGAIARTAVNIRAGGKSPISAFVHSLFVLLGMVLLAPALGYLPMAALGALLLIVAWNMSEVRHFRHILKVAPRSDVLVLLTCFGLTVLLDMVWAVSVGVVLAALLFMRRMAELSETREVVGAETHAHGPIPKEVLFYAIAGPLFFGAAQKAFEALGRVDKKVQVVLLDLSAVPAIDVTGLVALESMLERMWKSRTFVVLGGVQVQPRAVLKKAGLKEQPEKLKVCASLADAVAFARERVAGGGKKTTAPPAGDPGQVERMT